MKNVIRTEHVVLALILALLFSNSCSETSQSTQTDKTIIISEETEEALDRICFKEHCFEVELATTPDEHALGLMFREHIDDDRGMLFIFGEEKEYVFWMKNTLIPLDIIWINSDKKVVYIGKNARPCSVSYCPDISPGKKAKYVLELNSGMTDAIGLAEGDKITFYIDD